MNDSADIAIAMQPRTRQVRSRYILLPLSLVLALAALWSALVSQANAGYGTTERKSNGTSPSCDPEWTVVTSTNVGTSTNKLSDVSAVSANDVWAVGHHRSNGANRTLIERWNGTGWNSVASPNLGTGDNTLYGVSAISANDVWAVGTVVIGSTNKTWALRWNGSTWNAITSPNVGTGDNYLLSVDAISANDVWAVGYYVDSSVYRTLAMHWDGTAWTQVSMPNVGSTFSVVVSTTTISANDVWAVGYYRYAAGILRTLTIHWDGSTWSVIPSPNVGVTINILYGVSHVSATNVWAVGNYQNGTNPTRTLILQWDGNTWNAITSPNAGADYNNLRDVAAVSADDVWAVGTYGTGATQMTQIQRWNGSAWSVVANQSIGFEPYLEAVTVVSANDIWAVGTYMEFPAGSTLVERYNPCVASPTPTTTPVSSSTPTSTDTPVPTQSPGGPTATSTHIACSIEFTDVPPGSTFYDFVRCMACQGIINGYTSGCETGSPCFRPNNNVTRGQLAKIVANAAAFSEPAGAQQYEDVPPGSTFYDFVWRLADRSFVSGYPCGGAGEPCGTDSLPYFRPNGNASRGQISKIVSNAAAFKEPPGAQIFEDVLPGSTFYDFVQRLANRTVMSGYPCGGPGEPCSAYNLPYFRPQSNATRGQTSKVVSNAFFPDCATP